MKTHKGSRGKFYSFFNYVGENGGRCSTPHQGRFTPAKRDPVPISQEAGWAPGPVWTGAEYLAPTDIRAPDRPAHSKWLHRLCHPGPRTYFCKMTIYTDVW